MNDSKQAVCVVGEPGCAEFHPVTCCTRPKPVVNQQGQPYCARCWASLTDAGLPVNGRGVEWTVKS